MRLALMKRHAMASPFERAFDEFAKLAEEASQYTSESAPQGVKEGGQVMAVHYREEEAIYIKASWDRVTVIFSTVFREETDRIFGKVFLQEFVDARRRVLTLQNAPQVLFRNDPPLELEGVPGLQNAGEGEISYVTFGNTFIFSCSFRTEILTLVVLFPRHLTPQRRYENISHIQTFRDYFHYHIKASKVASRPYFMDLPNNNTTLGIHPHQNAQEDSGLPPGPQQSSSRKRGERKEDGQWTYLPSPRLVFGFRLLCVYSIISFPWRRHLSYEQAECFFEAPAALDVLCTYLMTCRFWPCLIGNMIGSHTS
ncbi:hypothetical protein AWENTII_001852 [Aspergillus wentii]